jgi:DNA-binding CsgD family transcriptional regulator
MTASSRFSKLLLIAVAFGAVMGHDLCNETDDDVVAATADDMHRSQVDLIDLIYDALLDDALWRDIAVFLAATFTPFPIVIYILDTRKRQVSKLTPFGFRDISPLFLRALTDKRRSVASTDPRTLIIDPQNLLSRLDNQASAISRQFLLDNYLMCALGEQAPEQKILIVALHPRSTSATTMASARATFLTLAPHLIRALRIKARIQLISSERDLGLSVASDVATESCVVDQDCVIRLCSRSLKRRLDAKAGLACDAHHRLRASAGPEHDRKLTQEIRALAQHPGTGTRFVQLPSSSMEPLSLRIAAMNEVSQEHGAMIRILVSDLKPPLEVPVELAARTLGLTDAEARAVIAIASSNTIEAAARSIGISINTIRTQIKHAMRKTDTHKQAQLVALLLRATQA